MTAAGVNCRPSRLWTITYHRCPVAAAGMVRVTRARPPSPAGGVLLMAPRPVLGTIPRPATAAHACVWYGFRDRQGQALVADRNESGAWNRWWCDSGRH